MNCKSSGATPNKLAGRDQQPGAVLAQSNSRRYLIDPASHALAKQVIEAVELKKGPASESGGCWALDQRQPPHNFNDRHQTVDVDEPGSSDTVWASEGRIEEEPAGGCPAGLSIYRRSNQESCPTSMDSLGSQESASGSQEQISRSS